MRLAINTGSTSKKYSLYNAAAAVFTARFEGGADGFEMITSFPGEEVAQIEISDEEYAVSLKKVFEIAERKGLFTQKEEVTAIGVRVVCPGTYFTEHRLIDDEFLNRLEEMQPYAPLHITPALAEIKAVCELLPDVSVYGVSDSAFHKTIPEAARRYSIRNDDTELYDIWRFGYHGLSMSSVMRKLELKGEGGGRTIVCHVGGGVSITAVKDGESVDTSMGFSPVGGMHMSTRTGDIDPGAVMYLMQKKGLTCEDAREYFNKEGGFKGVTDGVSDMRVLLDRYHEGDEKAVLAMDMFMYRIRKCIGGYTAILGGLDTLVLTATVNERNAFARSLICGRLEHMGIQLDDEKNTGLVAGEDGLINSDDSTVKIKVVHTDEMGEIARATAELRSSS